MASLMELVDRVNRGDAIDSSQLEIYQESTNSAEKFLAHHAHAMLELRRAQQHILQSLEAIEYSDQKVLQQFISISSFLGLNDLRAGPVVKFGAMAINRREYALGIEAIASAVAFDLAHAGGGGGVFAEDKENQAFISSQYERAAQMIGWTPNCEMNWGNAQQSKLALIVSGIADDEASGRLIRGLAKYLDSNRDKLHVYSTESAVRRDRQQFAPSSYAPASGKRGWKTLQMLAKAKIPVVLAETEGDAVSAARELADQLIKDRIDLAILDANQSDPIAALLGNWQIAIGKLNLCRRTPLWAYGVACITYLDPVRFETDQDMWRLRGIDSTYLLEGIDTSDVVTAAGALLPSRAQYAIPDQAIVLATASADLDKALSEEFCEMLISILRANPNAIYLAIGEGELAWQKRKFESAGVGKRVGYTGKRRDLPAFLRIADIYLAEFPAAGAPGVLGAMSVERPVVAAKWGHSSAESGAAALIGTEFAIGMRDAKGYIERVNKLIKDAGARAKVGAAMRDRVDTHFSMAQTAHHLEQLCDQLLARKDAAQEATTIIRDEPVQQVA